MLKNLMMHLLRAPAHALRARRERRVSSDLDPAIAAFNEKKYPEAVEYCKALLTREPRSARANLLCGQALLELDHSSGAIPYFEAAIAANPDLAEAHSDHSIALFKTGNPAAAEAACRKSVLLRPGEIKYRLRLAELLEVTGRGRESLAELAMALECAPERLDLLARLSDGLQKLGLYPEMLRIANRAILDNGENYETLLALAVARFLTTDIHGAIESARKALTLAADRPEAYVALGSALFEHGEIDDALAAYRRALKVRPGLPDALFNIGLIHLRQGKYREGWTGFEHRFGLKHNIEVMRPCTPRWNGTSLRGRTLLVMREQGLGDEIMYASCYPQIIKDAERCLIECEPRLQRLFERSFPEATFFPLSNLLTSELTDPGVEVDVRSYAGSLPRYLRNSLRDFPDHQGYLRADPERIAFWRERLAGLGDGLKVGISWRGGTVHSFTGKRTLPLAALLPALSVPGVQWINLQYGRRADEITAFHGAQGIPIADWPEAVDGDYDETAALVSALDLVISVCTSVVHLAGALGKPVWVMAPYVPEWRYGLHGENLPWYPSVRMLRQPSPGAWQPVISGVEHALREWGTTSQK